MQWFLDDEVIWLPDNIPEDTFDTSLDSPYLNISNDELRQANELIEEMEQRLLDAATK